jgi:ribosomal protein S18 acetylase RimI-like enzyme
MQSREFEGYMACLIPDYAAEIAANYDLPLDRARARAERETADELPQGPDTEGHDLLVITGATGTDPIGYVWYSAKPAAKSAFIYDFQILPAHQGMGHGTRALRALEHLLIAGGISEIRLRVAADNARAQHVYAAGGFRVSGINMSKQLAVQE